MPHPPVHEAPAKLSRRFAASELVLMQVKADVASDVVLKKIRFGTYVKQLELNRTSCRIVDMPRTREENTEVCVIGEIFRRRVDRARPHPLDRFQRTIAPLVKNLGLVQPRSIGSRVQRMPSFGMRYVTLQRVALAAWHVGML
jgi:hypothetical protein